MQSIYNPLIIRPQDFVPNMYRYFQGVYVANIVLPFLLQGRPIIFDYKEDEYTLMKFRIKLAPLFYNGLMDTLTKELPLSYLENMVRFEGLTDFYETVKDVIQHW